jgi:hypothetical protein
MIVVSLSKAFPLIGSVTALQGVLYGSKDDIHDLPTARQKLKFLLFPTGGLSDASQFNSVIPNSDCTQTVHHYTLAVNWALSPYSGQCFLR